ncbi:toll/interleukin-1 receptor domain-containing protein [Methyloversatilis universalis]|uniref:toll/interleukin-1 receptor domain-containing protein n=1 Tax=Methyloversatilis universalis TaxID=378211 RepID=UPI00036CE4E3|nr:toll/interleukin-1 receptor domain-containing protein [Methyloversatilis universalis]
MKTCIFLSHNSADKPFARRLASDLEAQGVGYWLDEAEIKVGESLIERIREGIDDAAYVAVILSPDSVKSLWVQREVDVAINQEIQGRRVKVLPVMYRMCDLPGFLLGKKYADFTDPTRYEAALKELVHSVGVVFRRNALSTTRPAHNIGSAIDQAWSVGLPMLSRPFHRPFQYMGMTVTAVAAAVGSEPNRVGNIIVDSDECHMLLEAEGNFINYVSVDLKRSAPQYRDRPFDPVPALGALSVNPAELELVRSATHYHHYSDHRRKLKVSVSCLEDGGPLMVGFSSKYYGM